MSEAISIENPKVPASEVFAKEGYKKTKLGWIPEEWSVKSLGEIGVFSKGKGISKSEITETGLPCVRYAEIYTKYNNYVYCFNSFINRNSAQNSKTIESGDILFAGSGETLEDIGKCIPYLGKETVYAGGDIIVLKPKTENSKYLSFALNHSIANKQKHKLGQGHSVVHIYSSSLKNLKIILPPLPEQQKIAAILSTWDNAIGKQEQLIAVKQHFKKGLIQLLLTGKKRFDGFSGEWIESKLGNYCNVLMCKRIFNSETSEIGEIPFYKIGTVGKKPDAFISRKLFQEYKEKYNYPRLHEILITCSGTVGKCIPYNGEDAYFQDSNIVWIDNPKNEIDNKFLYYLISTFDWDKLNSTTITRIYTNDLKSMRISFPSFKEQQKIASVLSNADKEISILQNQLTQLQTQKRGLMQQLLTGKVRVKI
ncbi:MAG: restriction endonuclease subunit S [Flavobacteriaceae bacterium]|nr:restriction endonuclease subunit S [Flavobacteriaceae bacterium]